MSKVKNKKAINTKIRTATICASVLVFTLALAFGAAILGNIPSAEAASFSQDGCMNGFSAKGINVVGEDVLAIKNMCSDCGGGGTGPYGVLWFNDSMTDPRGNIVRIDSWGQDTKQVSLWGGVYSCNGGQSSLGVDNWAHFVWFGLPGEMKGNGTTIAAMQGAADFFDLTQSYYGDSVYRAVFRGKVASSKYAWSNFDVTPSTTQPNSYLLPNIATFYPKKFREAVMNSTDPNSKCEDIVEGGVPKLKCSMQISVNRCYSAGSPAKYFNNNGARGQRCYGDPSELVLIAPPYNDGGFSSWSKVSADSGTSESPNWDQDAPTLEVEADASGNATVKFSHKLQYVAESPSGNYNDASTDWTITIDDGSGGPWTGTYSTPGGANAESNWLPETGEISTTINLGTASEKTVCSTITYTPKSVQWDNNDPRNMVANTDPNNYGTTKACAKIVESPVQQAGTIEFWSVSHVSSVRDSTAPDVVAVTANTYDNINQTNKIDGDKVTLRLSTDFPSAHANFSHDLTYVIKLNYTLGANDKITGTNMCTTWTIESDTSSNGSTGKKCASSGKNLTGSFIGVSTTTNHTVTIASKNSAEEKIKFEKKTVPVLRKEIKYDCGTTANPNKKCSYEPKRWEYYSEADTGSGQGSSTARIEYENPPEPDGDGPETKGAGSAEGSPIYAGEEGIMIWRAHAKPTETRRVDEYQSVAFLVQVSKELDPNSTKSPYLNTTTYKYNSAQDRNKNAPCDYWGGKLPLRTVAGGCQQVTSKTILNKTFGGTPGGSTSESEVSLAGEQENMAVPDWVGDKYCNSFGYRWGYYHGIMNTKGTNAGTWTWTRDGQPYWVHYNASCRSIAKKPSVALWNGGLFVGAGDVVASTSPRRNPSPQVGMKSSDSSLTIRHYGSWSEYLANVNGSVGGAGAVPIPGYGGASGLFASAASYAWDGSSKTSAPENSVLTIQNYASIALGNSGVGANSALMDRLEAYFKNEKVHPSSESLIGGITVNDSKIYYVDGPVNITGDIKLDTSLPKNSIFQIPQVVIFATGDININPNVKQIDAWLISKGGKIDTCYNSYSTSFIKKETQARVDTGLGSQANPDGRNNACQEKLIINGPVLAKTITTTRSFGSDGISNSDKDTANAPTSPENMRAVPAEVFNLSAENYLWAYAQAGRYNSSYTEAYSRELPPRY